MTFDESFLLLGNGSRVRRAIWPENVYLTMDGDQCSPSHLMYCAEENMDLWSMQTSYAEDTVAEDWEEFPS